MKKLRGVIALLLCCLMSFENVAFAAENTVENKIIQEQKTSIVISDNGVIINGIFYTQTHFEELLETAVYVESSKGPMTRSATVTGVAAGTYLIPGVGQVLITATGVIIIGGVTIAAGTWVAKKISAWFNQQKIISAVKKKIPSRLKDKKGNVNLGKFKNKVKKKTAYKESGGWMIDKDNAGHGGRKWKLKDKSGKRIGSLDGNGKVLGD